MNVDQYIPTKFVGFNARTLGMANSPVEVMPCYIYSEEGNPLRIPHFVVLCLEYPLLLVSLISNVYLHLTKSIKSSYCILDHMNCIINESYNNKRNTKC